MNMADGIISTSQANGLILTGLVMLVVSGLIIAIFTIFRD